jgi:probable F420-dependent oxidoreductase
LTNQLSIWVGPEGVPGSEVLTLARRVEELGYPMLWVNETLGREPFALCAALGAVTTRLVLGTGVANVYNRHPGVMKQGANTIAELTGGRFVLGLGVSSPQIVERQRGIAYDKPLSFLREFLESYDSARYMAVPPAQPVPIVLAALGPKMLELASEHAGAITYNVPPEHTAMARPLVGSATLYVEQMVVLTTDAEKARAVAASTLRFYARAPGYRNMWKACGFTDDDIDNGSNRWLDAIVAWGDEATIRRRLDEQFAAGADHVCIQIFDPDGGPGIDDRALAAFAPGA